MGWINKISVETKYMKRTGRSFNHNNTFLYINHLMIAGKSLGKKFNTDQRPLVIQIILMFPDPKLESF